MANNKIERFEDLSLDKEEGKEERTEKIKDLNKMFKSEIKEHDGKFGFDKPYTGAAGLTTKLGYNESGNAVKEFYNGNKLVKTVERASDNNIKTVRFDDRGKPFLREIADLVKGTESFKVESNAEIVKGNFNAKTDQFGRTIESKLSDVQIKDGAREPLSKNLRTSAYKSDDHRGHVMGDKLGGPNTAENIVPMNDKVNLGSFKKIENTVQKLKKAGYEVDYEMKVNYAGSDSRPTSFEPKIKVREPGKADKVDFNEFRKQSGNEKFGPEIKKIYNKESFPKGEMNIVEKTATDIGEKVGLNHEYGLESGAIAGVTTATISTVNNVKDCLEGKTTVEEAAENITKDTGKAVIVGYGSGFVSKAVSSAMAGSSNAFISKLSKLGVPGAVVSFAINSYNHVKAYSEGEITGKELAYNLGETASGIIGSVGGTIAVGTLIAGSTTAGATAGSVIPGAGTLAGAILGCIGGMIGYALTAAAYKTIVAIAGKAMDKDSKELIELEEKAKSLEEEIIANASEIDETAVNEIIEAIKQYKEENELPY